MSSERESATPGLSGPWTHLDARERRVLGVLVEKAKTTPDTYPLSINALVTGCNQKSNRDPILNLTDLEVEDALGRCQKKGLAIKITGGRVVRWKHNLYDAWHVNKVELAVLGELLLRGPQTEGELRSRASRMEPIDDLDALRNALRPLVERKLVVYLTPEERRGAVLTHGFHDPHELERLRSRVAAEPVAEAPQPTAPPATLAANDERLDDLASGLSEAREEIAALKGTVAELREELLQLKRSLGV
ncbi:MAG TPA: YceH family protein [Gemmataceae bacterium]|nr:YceH family protein [Gemmataceae bacterium]